MTIRDEAFEGKPVSAFVVDAHTHLAPSYGGGWYQTPQATTNAAVVASLDRLGINCIVTAPHLFIVGLMAAANAYTRAAVNEFPGRIYGYIAICPGEGLDAIKAELNQYAGHPGFVGLKLLPGYHGSLLQKEYLYAADFADEKACPVLVHTWENKPPLSEFEAFASKRLRMQLLCAHQGGGNAQCSRQLAAIMKRQPNISMELCGSLVNTLAVEDLVELVGEDRLIYGSDQINLDPRYDFGRVVFSPLSDAVKKKVLAGNFLSLMQHSGMGSIPV